MNLLLAVAVAVAASAAEVPPAAAFSDEVRGALASSAVTVAKEGSGWMTIWPTVAAPAATGEKLPGANFGVLGSGALVGGLRLEAAWTDYKGNAVAPGDYTLRAWLLPEDGNHMGVAIWRDFLLLSSASDDRSAAPLEEAALLRTSNKAARNPHPAVFALFPVPEGKGAGAVFENELGQPTVVVVLGGVSVALVVAVRESTEKRRLAAERGGMRSPSLRDRRAGRPAFVLPYGPGGRGADDSGNIRR